MICHEPDCPHECQHKCGCHAKFEYYRCDHESHRCTCTGPAKLAELVEAASNVAGKLESIVLRDPQAYPAAYTTMVIDCLAALQPFRVKP